MDQVQTISLDRHYTITQVSGSILPMNGTVKSVQAGDNGLELLSKYWNDEWEHYYRQSISEGKTITSIHSYHLPEYGTKWFNITFAPAVENDRIGGVRITLQDITLEKLREQQSELSRKMENLSLLALHIAHKMNNPLATILNRIGCLLLEDLIELPTSYLKNELEFIQEVIYSMSNITNALEAFSHDSVKNFQSINLNDVIEKSIGVCKLLHSNTTIKYRIDLLRDLPEVFGNEITMEQCMINIFRNSIEAMPNGGVLTVKTFIDDNTPHAVFVHVEDNGIGIIPKNVAKVFDPFFTTKDENHYGLGLSISYGILTVHGGTVELDSTPLKGTRIKMTLPREQS
jgi:signal transduction histidine kinase